MLCRADRDVCIGVSGTTFRTGTNGSGASSETMPRLMTSWGLLCAWFERSFPPEHYHLGHEFESVRLGGSSVTLHR